MNSQVIFVSALFAMAAAASLNGEERAGACPAPSGLAGICVFDPAVNCIADSQCPAGNKCCSEGCGRVCKDVVTAHAGTCPTPSSLFGICVVADNWCGSDKECAGDEKCCPEGCNTVCKKVIGGSVVG